MHFPMAYELSLFSPVHTFTGFQPQLDQRGDHMQMLTRALHNGNSSNHGSTVCTVNMPRNASSHVCTPSRRKLKPIAVTMLVRDRRLDAGRWQGEEFVYRTQTSGPSSRPLYTYFSGVVYGSVCTCRACSGEHTVSVAAHRHGDCHQDHSESVWPAIAMALHEVRGKEPTDHRDKCGRPPPELGACNR